MNNCKKHLLIMGFGTQAVRYIESAKNNDCYISAGELQPFFDYEPNQKYIDLIDNKIIYNSFENESFLEMTNKVRQTNKLNGILPLTDAHVVATSFAAQELGLKSAGIKAAILSTNKGLQRTIFDMRGLSVPKYEIIDISNIEKTFFENLKYPKIIKPINKFGSIGVKIIYNKDEALEHIEELRKYSSVCLVEEYIDGQEISIESVVQDSEIKFVNITKKYTGNLPLFVEESHLVPCPDIEDDIKNKIYELNKAVIDVLEVKDSLVHLEAKINDNRIVIMEVAVRMPGDRIMDLIEISTGVNMYDCAVKVALGEKVECTKTKECLSRVFWFSSNIAGKIKEIYGINEIENMNETIMVGLLKEKGDYINTMNSSFDRVGFCIGKADNIETMNSYIKKVNEIFKVEVE